MKNKTRSGGGLQGMEWVAGSVVVLLLFGAGLTFFAQGALGKEVSEASTAAFLLALYLASWAYVLGLLGLLFLSVQWLENWWLGRVARVAMNHYSPTPQFLELGPTPPVPSRSPEESDRPNQAPRPSRVA